MKSLAGLRILILLGDDYEDLELWYPKLRLIEAGAEVTVAGPLAGKTYSGKHGYPCVSEIAISDASTARFDGLVIPGGWMPDSLRRDPKVLALVRQFADDKKPIGSICHGPSINVSAGICRGVKMTSSPGVKDDVINAGGEWSDASVVVDRHFVSSRRPADLPDFCERLIALLEKQR
ncbi:MAG: type 1 glutamine amidotransferase domain-containing protein [Phycisphaerae bacterium]